MPKAKRVKRRQYWIQVCLIFGQITFAGAWAGLFIPFDLDKIFVVIYNIVATATLVAIGWWLNEKT